MAATSRATTSPKQDCDLALALIVVPFLLPFSWMLLARRYLTPPPQLPQQRREYLGWRRKLTALVCLDTVLVAGLLVMALLGLSPAEPLPPQRIGVLLDPAETHAAKVVRVVPDSPAAVATLAPGDIIETVDDAPVADNASLRAALNAGEPGRSRALRVRRGAQILKLRVVPNSGSLSAERARGFFESDGGGQCGAAIAGARVPAVAALASGLGAMLLLWFYTVVRGGLSRGGWGGAIVAMAVAPIAGAVAGYAGCQRLGGMSLAVALIGLLAQGGTLLLVGALVWWRTRKGLALVLGPRLTFGHTVARGALFMMASIVRLGLATTIITSLAPQIDASESGSMVELFGGGGSLIGKAMVLVAAVILGPLAEEVVFRGLVLPGLARHMAPYTALWVTAILFAIFHIPSHGGGALIPGFLGVIFGWARLRSGNLRAAVVLHAANNLFVTLLAWLAAG